MAISCNYHTSTLLVEFCSYWRQSGYFSFRKKLFQFRFISRIVVLFQFQFFFRFIIGFKIISVLADILYEEDSLIIQQGNIRFSFICFQI